MLRKNYAAREEEITLHGKKKLGCSEKRNYAVLKEEITLQGKKKITLQ
jgi:hypothetical protein